MTRILLSFVVSLILFSSCKKDCPPVPVAECASIDLTKGLLAYYPFNGNMNDASGNNLNGIPQNGAKLGSDYLGRPGKAAEFDGADDYILIEDGGKLGPEEVTISMWVMAKTTFRRQAFINRVDPLTANAPTYGMGQSLDVTQRWEFGIVDPTSADFCTKSVTYSDTYYARSPEQNVAGQWYHLIGSFSKGTQKLYVDGQLRSTLTRGFTTLKNCPANKVLIGGWWNNDIISMDGKIDEVRIYNRALTDCEIAELSKLFKQ